DRPSTRQIGSQGPSDWPQSGRRDCTRHRSTAPQRCTIRNNLGCAVSRNRSSCKHFARGIDSPKAHSGTPWFSGASRLLYRSLYLRLLGISRLRNAFASFADWFIQKATAWWIGVIARRTSQKRTSACQAPTLDSPSILPHTRLLRSAWHRLAPKIRRATRRKNLIG